MGETAAATSRKGNWYFPSLAGFAASVLVAAASLGGIFLPGTYAKETPSLAAQGVGQDWVNLAIIVPYLAVTAGAARGGSRRGRMLLGGGLAYTAYSYVVYAFGVHFNQLFLIYCAALGLSVFGLAAVGHGLMQEDARAWYGERTPRRAAAWTQIAIAAIFALVWLSDIVPALLRGGIPRAVAQDGLFTNPVHVLDLSIVLPALAASGIGLLRRRPAAYVWSPILLGLAVLMAIAIGGMVVAVFARGLAADATVSILFAAIAAGCGTVLVRLLRTAGTGAGPI